MKRKLILGAIALLGLASYITWTLVDWPPPRLVLKYGIPPYCAPTGNETTIEGIEFVEIGAGCFRMGSTAMAEGGDTIGRLCSIFGLPWGDQPRPSDEMPVHWVEFERGFWIARTEVTTEQFARSGEESDRAGHSQGDKLPVQVPWVSAKVFCRWLSRQSGHDIRLPSEAMWEASCRGGSKPEYSLGDDQDRLGEFAWCNENSRVGGVREVGTRRANGWGLFDLHGNVWEWCQDTYHGSYEGAPADGAAWLEGGEEWADGTLSRIGRGGNVITGAWISRSEFRNRFHPGTRGIGFRPAIWPPDQ